MIKRILVTSIVAALTITMTLIVFFLAINNPNSAQRTALVFMLIAELMPPLVIIIIELSKAADGVMIRAGSASILATYFLITLLVSLVLIAVVKNPSVVVAINTIILGLFAISMVLLFAASHSFGYKNQKTLQNVAKIQLLEAKALGLKNNPFYSEFAPQLNKIADAVKYCDFSAYTPIDATIERMINDLEEFILSANTNQNKEETVKELTEGILAMFKQRAQEAINMKRGSI